MTPAQRMRRAAEILWGGIARWQLAELNGSAQATSAVPATPDTAAVLSEHTPATADQVLAFLSAMGHASPRDVARHFTISRSSASRRLHALLDRGVLECMGQTNAVTYRVRKVVTPRFDLLSQVKSQRRKGWTWARILYAWIGRRSGYGAPIVGSTNGQSP